MVLFVLRKLILQTRMRSHPVGLDVWFFIETFVYFHTSCMQTAKALARLRRCAGSPEPSLVAYVISTTISWAGSFYFVFKHKDCLKFWFVNQYHKWTALSYLFSPHQEYNVVQDLYSVNTCWTFYLTFYIQVFNRFGASGIAQSHILIPCRDVCQADFYMNHHWSWNGIGGL